MAQQPTIRIGSLFSIAAAVFGVYATYTWLVPWINESRQASAETRAAVEELRQRTEAGEARAAELARQQAERDRADRERRRNAAINRPDPIRINVSLPDPRDRILTLDDPPPETKAPVDPEVAAARKLSLARSLADPAKRKAWLEEIVRDYPETDAAREAAELAGR